MNYNKIPHYILLFILLCSLRAQDFSPGPYGINYFDIAGPFTIEDLSVRQTGDLDGNRFIDLKDILLYTSYLDGEINLSDQDLDYADINDDMAIDILDIILLVNMILFGEYNQIADLNFDGVINILDIIIYKNIILNS